MARVSAAARKKMPKKNFALPDKEMFLINDDNHARAALSDVSRSLKAGNITPAEAAKVRRAARKKLGETPTKRK